MLQGGMCIVRLSLPWRQTDRQRAVILWSASGHRHAENETLKTVGRPDHFFQELFIQEASSAYFRMTDKQVAFKTCASFREENKETEAKIYLEKEGVHAFK